MSDYGEAGEEGTHASRDTTHAPQDTTDASQRLAFVVTIASRSVPKDKRVVS